MYRLKVSALLVCCAAVFCVRAVPTFGNEYVHIKLHVPKTAAINAHDNLHKLENVAQAKHHGAAPAHNVIHHYYHHHEHRPQAQKQSSHISRLPHRRPTGKRPNYDSHHQHHHHPQQQQQQHHHQHHNHNNHNIVDTVVVSELKDVSDIAHLDYINHANDIAQHVAQTLPSHKPAQFVETYKFVEEKKPPPSYQYTQPTSHLDTYHVIDTARIPTTSPQLDTVKIIESVEPHHHQHHQQQHHHHEHEHQYQHHHQHQQAPSQSLHQHHHHLQHHQHYQTVNAAAAAAAVADHHDYSPQSQNSYQTHYASQATQQLSDSYGPPPAQITALEEVLDSYHPPHYSELKAPSPRPVYGVPAPTKTIATTTTTKQPTYPSYVTSNPTYSYHHSTHTYVPPPPPPSPPASSSSPHYQQSHLDYQGYDQTLSHFPTTQQFKPSTLYKGYEANEGTDFQQLSDGYLPPDTLTPPAGDDGYSSNVYANSYEDQTLAGVGEAEDETIPGVWPESADGFRASETYVGIDSYSAGHVQGVDSSGYAYGEPYP